MVAILSLMSCLYLSSVNGVCLQLARPYFFHVGARTSCSNVEGFHGDYEDFMSSISCLSLKGHVRRLGQTFLPVAVV